MMNSTLVATLVFLVTILFVHECHCSAILPMDAKLIEQTCRKTPHPGLCISYLKSDPRSARADVQGLALIMVDVVGAKITSILKRIDTLLKKSPGDKSLQYCNRLYHSVLKIDIGGARGAMGDPKFAEQDMNEVSIVAGDCESQFKGKPLLSKLSKDIDDASRVTSAIVKILE